MNIKTNNEKPETNINPNPFSKINTFYLGGFKAFKDVQEVPIRPITLVFGPNSSGKSSLVKGMVAALEGLPKVTEESNSREAILNSNSGLINFAFILNKKILSEEAEEQKISNVCNELFELSKNAIDLSKDPKHYKIVTYEIGASYNVNSQNPVESIMAYDDFKLKLVGDRITELVSEALESNLYKLSQDKLFSSANIDAIREELYVISVIITDGGALGVKNIPHYIPGTQQRGGKLKFYSGDKSKLTKIIEQNFEFYFHEDLEQDARIKHYESVISEKDSKSIHENAHKTGDLGTHYYQIHSTSNYVLAPNEKLIYDSLEVGREEWRDLHNKLEPTHINYYTQKTLNSVSKSRESGNVNLVKKHLHQALLNLVEDISLNHQHQIKKSTVGLAKILYIESDRKKLNEIDADNVEIGTKWLELLSNNKSIELINIWLSDPAKLATNFKIWQSIKLNSDADLQKVIDGIIDRKHIEWGETSGIRLLDVRVKDRIMKFDDVGYGIQKLIPVLAAAAAPKDDIDIIAIEEPEMHLHPKLQSDLGDLFVDNVINNSEKTFILETHSEHLLLRILKRVRDGDISKDAISVLYVHPGQNENGAIVEKLELDDDGDFLRPWPPGFFDVRHKNLF